METHHLDPHCEAILEQYHTDLHIFKKLGKVVIEKLNNLLSDAAIIVAALEHRIKSEESLCGKLELKGAKYKSINDITDIVGARIITFYLDDVDKVASMVEHFFEIDWDNSIDKRRINEIDSFGYLSLHYICRIPKELYYDPEFPQINQIRFELQMRTILQHSWANLNHDAGYKNGVEVPKVYLRNLNRIAGMLELIDDEFSRIRTELADYRRKIQMLVASGNLDEVPLDGDSFKSYISLDPFKSLNKKIAAVNQAEIQEVSIFNYLKLFKAFGFSTLGDIDKFIKKYSQAAYQIACFQISLTDIDIVSSSLAPQNLCIAYVLSSGGGKVGLKYIFDTINGPSENNEVLAEYLFEQTKDLPFMNQKSSDKVKENISVD